MKREANARVIQATRASSHGPFCSVQINWTGSIKPAALQLLSSPPLTRRPAPLILNSSVFFSYCPGGPQALQIRIYHHDKCFDGAGSASLFRRFHTQCIDHDAGYEYQGLVHRAGALVGGPREESDKP